MDDMNWRSAMDSEIFRGYLAAELQKQAANKKTAEQIADEELAVLNQFEDFQLKVNSSKKQKAIFKHLQEVFQTNEKYAATVDPKFVELVLLLNID
jgi:hypothetical protein